MKKGVMFGILGVILTIIVGAYFYFANPFDVSPSENDLENITGEIVLIDGFKYEPQDLTISVGETVTWTNEDSVQHTVTSDEGSELSSELFGKDESYSHIFNEVGVYPYHCIPHPMMTGTVTVEA